jgi:hypothetical protein
MKRVKTPDERKIRLTIDVTPEFYERLERLEKRTEVGSKATLIRQALQLFEYFVLKTEEGKEIVIRTPSGDDEKNLEFFPLISAGGVR